MIKTLEVGKYYRIIEKETIYKDTKNNKIYSDSEINEKFHRDVLASNELLKCEIETLFSDYNIFEDDDDMNRVLNKKYDEAIEFFKHKKQESIKKFDSVINKYEKIAKVHKELDNWVDSLHKSIETTDKICFRMDEIKILLSSKEEWEENLESDEVYRIDGILNNEVIDSTDYVFTYLEMHEFKVKHLSFDSLDNFEELNKDEIEEFEKQLKREEEYFMSLENPDC